MGVLGPHHDGGGGAVAHTRAVEHAERARHPRGAADRLGAHLALELGARVAGAVVMVLGGDVSEHAAQLVLVDTELLRVGRHDHAVHGGRRQRAVGAIGGHLPCPHGALVAAVLDLLDTDSHRNVVGARGDGVGGAAQRLRAGGAVVLHVGDGFALDLERTSERDATVPGHGGAEPVGVDRVLVDAGGSEGLVGGVDHQVVGALVPTFAERRAAHPDDGNAVLDPVRTHVSQPSLAPATTGRAFQK